MPLPHLKRCGSRTIILYYIKKILHTKSPVIGYLTACTQAVVARHSRKEINHDRTISKRKNDLQVGVDKIC